MTNVKEEQYAVSVVLPNFAKGCYWGFTTMEEALQYVESLKNNPNVTARKIGDRCLVEVKPDYLYNQLAELGENVIKQADVQYLKRSSAEARVDLERFLIKCIRQGNFCNKIAIYCTNNTPVIHYRDMNFPAFKLSMTDAFPILAEYGFQLRVNGVYVNINEFVNQPNAIQAMCNSMFVSPTNTGIFIDIKATDSPNKVDYYEQIFNKKYQIA